MLNKAYIYIYIYIYIHTHTYIYIYIYTHTSACYFNYREFLTGFHKRKDERRKRAQEELKQQLQEEKKTRRCEVWKLISHKVYSYDMDELGLIKLNTHTFIITVLFNASSKCDRSIINTVLI